MREPGSRPAPDACRGPAGAAARGARAARCRPCHARRWPCPKRPLGPADRSPAAPARLEWRDQPDRDPRAHGPRPRARPRQPLGRPDPAGHAASTRCSTWAAAAAFPACPWPWSCPPAGLARRERRQEGHVPDDRRRARSPSAAPTGFVDVAAARAEALAAEPSHRERWQAVTARAIALAGRARRACPAPGRPGRRPDRLEAPAADRGAGAPRRRPPSVLGGGRPCIEPVADRRPRRPRPRRRREGGRTPAG